eukprot:gene8201-5726_t
MGVAVGFLCLVSYFFCSISLSRGSPESGAQVPFDCSSLPWLQAACATRGLDRRQTRCLPRHAPLVGQTDDIYILQSINKSRKHRFVKEGTKRVKYMRSLGSHGYVSLCLDVRCYFFSCGSPTHPPLLLRGLSSSFSLYLVHYNKYLLLFFSFHFPSQWVMKV